LEKLLAGVRPSVVGLENIFDTMCHLSVLSEYYNEDITDNNLSRIKRKNIADTLEATT
jgi:hypothetical protein